MPSGGHKILVVEDEPILRELASEMLSDTGYDFYEAGSGDEALAILGERAAEICLLFTDVNMAGSIDGLRLAQVVAESWPSIAIIITSGRGAPRRDEMPDGARFTPKPWRQATLVEQIQSVCVPEMR